MFELDSNVLHLKIWRLAQDGKYIEVLLDKKDGINNPIWLHSTEKGKQLTVVNENGQEIRNYNIYKVIESCCYKIDELIISNTRLQM